MPVHPTAVRRPHSIVEHITAKYVNRGANVAVSNGQFTVTPTFQSYEFQTKKTAPRQGILMMIGLGGNNGSTYVLPMVHPNDLVLGGWDISGLSMDKAMERAQVLDYDLQRQEARADNLIPGEDKQVHLEHIRADIRKFKQDNALDRTVVDIIPGVNDTADNLLAAIKASHSEGEPFVNGAPQNTFVPGVIELAERHQSFIGGDDLKSGQTKLKSVLAEFLRQFKSKEISKSSVVDDMVDANRLLYKAPEGEHPDHIVVINKRAIDEYYSEIFCGGRSTINIFNECEDSLLATPLILDLAILTELLTRIKYRTLSTEGAKKDFAPLYPVLSLLSYMLKAPLVKPGTEVVNSLNRQRNALEGFLKACIGLENNSDLLLETRIW
ncbi:hypothetical protein B0H13DRAFT_1958016 [Mycena leptocephala]|nr:hypothetical protein B0H13DRAFT_1958016 [Mycena leptocephala]